MSGILDMGNNYVVDRVCCDFSDLVRLAHWKMRTGGKASGRYMNVRQSERLVMY